MHASPSYTARRFTDEQAGDAERTYSTFQHLAGLLGLTGAGVAGIGLIATIILWRIKANESAYLDDHGREAVNFQISMLVYMLVALVLTLPTVGLIWVAFLALQIVGCVRGAMAAHRGQYYRYPMCIRFLCPKSA